ncbi:PA0069 family radical SAM protein [Robertkochia aurantiaca]|uniref:PA0069 family radical SAM protein n=1 Tax=Robertkochia aurantiaca TaxID=2873700 RepID=UPI001CCB1D27|nr:PA0069 family radical SAM protein [Robertkochia sp. 3YJGBD-33]
MSELLDFKGRGAQQKAPNRFEKHLHQWETEFLEHCYKEGEEDPRKVKTKYLEVYPKSIVNKVNSPDVGMTYSLNPYQGCEHGCIYCYARNSHEYWGYDAGVDFESRILVKKNAPKLLEKKLLSRNWKARTIVLSGNTDCYQPAEQKFRLTRACLEVFLKYEHPVGIITKNAAILRDLDILRKLAEKNLVVVNISVTTLEERTRRLLEPRTASIQRRLQAVETLSGNGIPVRVMIAPIIPGINSHEILPIAKAAKDKGASSIGFTVVRLNGAIADIFTDWIHKAMPARAEKVLNQIKACHGGQLNDSRFGIRNRGEGVLASHLHKQFEIARNTYFSDTETPQLNHGSFESMKQKLRHHPDQLSLW